MPKAMEDKLTKEATAKHLKGKSAKAYIFGTMRKAGWSPKPTMADKKEIGATNSGDPDGE